MLIEQRIYNVKPGALPRFLDLVEREELPLLGEAGKHISGYYFTEIGELNAVIGQWKWDSMDQRKAVRDAMIGRFLAAGLDSRLLGLTVSQSNQLWQAAPFFDADKGRLR
ncbi:hypothetical protein GG804_28000 [Sphingomonas histidinilytica]|jgi:hypothetical protein|uniref:NIPSNAP protein n=1 Tax=Rhizorhabdus histidinilytica TaxID=439228 RepID=A0A1T5EI01_9SPHN|nr:NIPSNAP family protein [Rhizorhabdus histidinilytica]MBO9380610.1 hypothetical protein [Rhizorhabdus histidinilytica]QEH76771.1 NIPSNAP family protein [Sphingomonas sp. C8-2]QEH81674.1 NIPSNAP family protein [Sphingomonas sp. C8-2]SKB83672.1 NIPSNAP protein [Rhizorhabdus histidinilytica]